MCAKVREESDREKKKKKFRKEERTKLHTDNSSRLGAEKTNTTIHPLYSKC